MGIKGKIIVLIAVVFSVLVLTGCSEKVNREGSNLNSVRVEKKGNVTVTVVLLDLEGEQQDIRFDITLDTHSVNLSRYDILSEVSLSSENGASLTGEELVWESVSNETHHIRGNLVVPGQLMKQPGYDKITLEIYNLDGVDVRQFTWNLK
ncbi:MAG: hypothetical protein KGZ79_02030 [Dethiobacter sp.]|jgi:hypothetical protein|nr:hypothetical protein [Dethiobacter sp.]